LIDQGRSHAPITGALAEPVVFLRAGGVGHLDEVLRGAGREVPQPPVAGLAQLRLTAKLIKLQDDFSVFGAGFFAHPCPPNISSLSPRGRLVSENALFAACSQKADFSLRSQ